jgi:hypothetical protein
MIEIGLPIIRARLTAIVRIKLGVPSTSFVIDKVKGGIIPELAVPGFVLQISRNLKQRSARCDSLGNRPSILVRVRGRAIPINGIAKTPSSRVPTHGYGLVK